jgi:tetratricopeptide (TPR) repeat protein
LANKSKENKLLVNDILAERAQLYYAMNMLDKADADYKQMIKNSELSLMARIGLARNMLSRGDYDGVIELLDNCEKINASYSEIYRFRMQAYYMKGETNKAINDAIMYIRIDDLGDFSAYDYILKMNLDYSYLAMKKLCAETNSINHRMLLTSICELRGDYAGAIAEYDKLENEIGPSASIYYFRSVAYSEIGEYEKAIEGMTKCLEMSEGKDFYVILLRADYYREMGKYEEAIADFSKAIELDPLDVYAYYKRGWCYELKGDDKTAMENYNTGITVGQDYPYIYLMRGTQYLKQGEIALANADFEVILAKDTVAVKGSCRHYALHFLGRNAEAIEWMDKIIELNPNDAGCYYDKACLYSRMGKLDEAVVALRIALEKGYRAFAHIENDNDMDAIRNRLDFIALIEEYKVK